MSLDPRALLGRPSLYLEFRHLLSGSRGQEVLVRDYIRAAPGDKVLDIGCGPGVMSRSLPDTDYTGIEPDPLYVEEGRRRLEGRGRILLGTAGTVALDDAGTYDIALAIAVLHHLDDGQARELLAFARAALGPKGRFISLDCCYTREQSRLARFVVGMDRGAHIRTPVEYERLVGEYFSSSSSVVRHDLLRIPYTHFICEARL